MNKEKLRLSENHLRSLSSALMTVEQMLMDMEAILLSQSKGCSYEVVRDVENDTIRTNLTIIAEARKKLCIMASKYETKKYSQSLRKIINAKKSRIWEILMDMKPKKQKGFGEFPKELAKEFESDLEELLEITENISC